jgi:outer membrane protein assembly factor BamD (BamD/ComL family)
MQALYELALLQKSLWHQQNDPEQKKKSLADTRATLTSFINQYPYSFFAGQAEKILDTLPSVE